MNNPGAQIPPGTEEEDKTTRPGHKNSEFIFSFEEHNDLFGTGLLC